MHRLEAFLRHLEVVPDDEVNHIVKRLSPKTNCQLLRIFFDSRLKEKFVIVIVMIGHSRNERYTLPLKKD